MCPGASHSPPPCKEQDCQGLGGGPKVHLMDGARCQSPPYREMSPQYHSASCKGALFPLARLAALGFGFGGLGGRAVRRGGIKQGEPKSQLPAGNPSEC